MLLEKPTTRRKFLLGALLALPVSDLLLKGVTAAQAAEMAAPELADYKPIFFSASEWQFILAATDRLIPAGGSGKAPGALETNVPIFIDQQLHTPEFGAEIYLQGPFDVHAPATMGYQIPFTPQQMYRTAIKLVEQWTQTTYQKAFHELSTEEKDAVLTRINKNDGLDFAALGEPSLKASQFFSQLLADTKHGYLADPMYGGNKGMKAWIAIGFPGARASFTEWVKQHNVPYPLGPVSLLGQRA
ncbi:gluconate 2-dehydrogenase [Pantoea sp. ICBG 1758]|jgi:gluconate 2-dehydrogenase gamma chain|uniref:gluconate 2-dehydrogenase subunit 3 family protein n=2 Tax=Erwiniaceae TaxID=1903409 RepID=UPI0008FD499A|nr:MULTISPECIES: gluconate 2-dehydrogenase subunit 3 family protein [Pantoea]KAA6045449.1 gluconate 2-dehydrogenase subunit 3 family protein [Pantoea sp. Bo_7]KAA6090797.1 gluconate 2-dehydrogenase subunit 3 family protein [Pantoea sp. Bo_10]MCL9646855.1 gluconate 2-dehydrogenase subunit 3 family protein [Pantoea eucrina]MDJ0022691.1 gluconate 2-dehydrogenase subunit 3 family protein [Pantoea eucrina]NIE71932.1 gluconate 2-dehydrogenase subunit 3 family protein [Pantoea sp. Acro-807]